MEAPSRRVPPLQLITLNSLKPDSNVSLDYSEIPQGPEKRRSTNRKWLIILVLFLAVLLPFFIYTLCYSDIRRVIWGYDKCGNICGQENYQWDDIKCSANIGSKLPYLEDVDGKVRLFDGLHCVLTCSIGHIPVMGRCLKEINQEPLSNTTESKNINLVAYFVSVKWQLVISCLSSVLVTIGIVFLFRYAEFLAVWVVMIGCAIGFTLLDALYCYHHINVSRTTRSLKVEEMVMLAVTAFTVFFSLLLYRARKKIQLLVCLLKKSNKAVFDMPGLMTIPVITCIVILIITILAGFLHLVIYSAGTLQNTSDDLYEYVSNPVIIITMVYNAVLYLWICRLCTSIQYMIISGAISKWYFTRDKNCLTSPIMTSVSIVFRFHLGTAALGAIIIPLVQVIKIIRCVIFKREVTKEQSNVKCLIAMEKWFRILYKTSYIVTGVLRSVTVSALVSYFLTKATDSAVFSALVMHGQAFIRSGRRALMLIIQNIRDIFGLNFLGDGAVLSAKVCIVFITLLLAMGVFAIAPGSVSSSNMHAYYVIGFISSIVAWVSLDVFETIMDTLFICYCEDSLLNDGIARPYFMSINLKEFVDSSKEYYRSLLPPTISVDNV